MRRREANPHRCSLKLCTKMVQSIVTAKEIGGVMSVPVLSEFRRHLVGRILTQIDASIADERQAEALKSVIRQHIQQSLSELEEELRGETQTEM